MLIRSCSQKVNNHFQSCRDLESSRGENLDSIFTVLNAMKHLCQYLVAGMSEAEVVAMMGWLENVMLESGVRAYAVGFLLRLRLGMSFSSLLDFFHL